MLNEDQIKKLFFDPIGERWGRFNTWLMEDDEMQIEFNLQDDYQFIRIEVLDRVLH